MLIGECVADLRLCLIIIFLSMDAEMKSSKINLLELDMKNNLKCIMATPNEDVEHPGRPLVVTALKFTFFA